MNRNGAIRGAFVVVSRTHITQYIYIPYKRRMGSDIDINDWLKGSYTSGDTVEWVKSGVCAKRTICSERRSHCRSRKTGQSQRFNTPHCVSAGNKHDTYTNHIQLTTFPEVFPLSTRWGDSLTACMSSLIRYSSGLCVIWVKIRYRHRFDAA